jgi:imidazolonepropionase-like amidohydrolase
MKTITVWLLAFVSTRSALAQENLRPDVPVALVGGQLLDGYEAEPIHHSVVVFENGRITAVGTKHDTEIPDNAVVIGTGGRTVVPGKLADIIVIDGNPLANIGAMQHVEIVIKDGGVWYTESAAYRPVTEIGHAF